MWKTRNRFFSLYYNAACDAFSALRTGIRECTVFALFKKLFLQFLVEIVSEICHEMINWWINTTALFSTSEARLFMIHYSMWSSKDVSDSIHCLSPSRSQFPWPELQPKTMMQLCNSYIKHLVVNVSVVIILTCCWMLETLNGNIICWLKWRIFWSRWQSFACKNLANIHVKTVLSFYCFYG